MSGQVWLNGALLSAGAARIDPTDRGFTLGDGVFETIAVRRRVPCQLDRHMARLSAGAAVLGIPLTWTLADVATAISTLLEDSVEDAAVRATLTRGPATRGVLPAGDITPTLLITAGPLPPKLPPARVVVARSTCRNEFSPLARIKSLNYLDNIIARREAAARGADDAILLNTRGNAAEATASTLLVLLDGAVVTPPLADGALPGIARARLIEAGRVIERSMSAADLDRIDGAALVNALGCRQVASLERRPLRVELPGFG